VVEGEWWGPLENQNYGLTNQDRFEALLFQPATEDTTLPTVNGYIESVGPAFLPPILHYIFRYDGV
jgi:hypothetical protein